MPGPLYEDLLSVGHRQETASLSSTNCGFASFSQLLLEDGLYLVELLGHITDDREEREGLLQSLIQVFEEKNAAGKLIGTLTYREIEQTSMFLFCLVSSPPASPPH